MSDENKDVPSIKDIVHRSTFEYGGHVLSLAVENGGTLFTDQHLALIFPVLDFFWNIDSQTVKSCIQLTSTAIDDSFIYGRYPGNGWVNNPTNQPFTIQLTKRGMQFDIPHRISPVNDPTHFAFISNFQGTVAHEWTHNRRPLRGYDANPFPNSDFNTKFIMGWFEKFDWGHVTYNDSLGTWKTVPGGLSRADGYFLGNKSLSYTGKPELCIGGLGGYAASHPMEDVCDSFAAVALKSPLLDSSKQKYIVEQIHAYHAH